MKQNYFICKQFHNRLYVRSEDTELAHAGFEGECSSNFCLYSDDSKSLVNALLSYWDMKELGCTRACTGDSEASGSLDLHYKLLRLTRRFVFEKNYCNQKFRMGHRKNILGLWPVLYFIFFDFKKIKPTEHFRISNGIFLNTFFKLML